MTSPVIEPLLKRNYEDWTKWSAILVVFCLALQIRLPGEVPLGLLFAVGLLPVTFGTMRRWRGCGWVLYLSGLAALAGVVLTMAAAESLPWSAYNTVANTARALTIGTYVLALLWAREILGARSVVLVYGAGLLASLSVVGVNPDNPWKFSFSVPVALLVLAWPSVYGHRWRELAALLALTGVSVLNDSRSAAAMLLIAGALVALQAARTKSRSTRLWATATQLGIAVGGMFFAVQAAILEGMLGEAAQQRTEMQIQQSGSVLLGGRPEVGAAVALLKARPMGFGSGTLATYDEIMAAKSAMADLGYDPNNRYVDVYMFGSGYEVHSVIGDLWLIYGLAGLLLALAILLVTSVSTLRNIAERAASAASLYLALRLLWDLPFSPLASALVTLPLAIAVGMVPIHSKSRVGNSH